MRLDPKYFSLFLLAAAILTTIVIFYGTISYRQNQVSDFNTQIAEFDSLSSVHFGRVPQGDSVAIHDYSGRYVILLFRSSWSGKSLQMQYEIEDFAAFDSLMVIAASVKDALTEVEEAARKNDFSNIVYVDGTAVYNRLKTPGIPSYILFDRQSEPVFSQVGYHEGEVRDSLSKYIRDE